MQYAALESGYSYFLIFDHINTVTNHMVYLLSQLTYFCFYDTMRLAVECATFVFNSGER